jgi:hypothetical protein
MKPFHLAVRPAFPRWLLVAGVLAVGVGCQRGNVGTRREQGPRATPAPTFQTIGAATRADLLAYAHGLQFDTTRPAMDAQHLLVPQGGHLAVGPYAELSPEIGTAAISHEDLAHGRILARLSLDQPCPQAGLARGATYIWVDSAAGGRQPTRDAGQASHDRGVPAWEPACGLAIRLVRRVPSHRRYNDPLCAL